MVGDFGTTSDFHAKKKATDFGDYRLSEYPATMKQTQKNPGSEIPRHNRTSVLVYNYIHLYIYIYIYYNIHSKKDTFYSVSNML